MAKKECPGAPDIVDQERVWAERALAHFSQGNYDLSLQNLVKLEAARPQDFKVLHNKAVVEYYISGLKKTDQFRRDISRVCRLACINVEDVHSLENVENCVIYYNQAVILYHLKQYSTALNIMGKVFSFIEPMEESLAHRVCLLFIELHLCTHQPEKALLLIAYIENQLISTDSCLTVEKDMQPLEEEEHNKKPVSLDAATDAFRTKLLRYRAHCYLLSHSLKACKRELTNIIIPAGLNLSLTFVRANLEYLRGNYKKAANLLLSVSQNNWSFTETGQVLAVLLFNDRACIHHYMGQPNLACHFLLSALQENEKALSSLPKAAPSEPFSGRPVYTLGWNKRCELVYNLGVALLHAEKPLQAFECLMEAVQVYNTNPRLWLRVAECCIMNYKADNEFDFNIRVRRNDLVQQVVGSGSHRKIILNSRISKDSQYSGNRYSSAVPEPTIEFATLCLKNALMLLPTDEQLLSREEDLEMPQESSQPREISANPSSPLNRREVASLRCSILAASAYVSLCLGDYVVALNHAQALLSRPKLSGVHRMLGHLYCAEALIMLDKISDAIEHLKPDHITDLSQLYPQTEEKTEWERRDNLPPQNKPLRGWYPNSFPTAVATMQYNLAVAFAIRGELGKASETLKKVWISKGPHCDVPIHVIMLVLYIELQLGHADVSRSIVKQHSHQCR